MGRKPILSLSTGTIRMKVSGKISKCIAPLLGEKALIAFHDIVVHPIETGCGVSQLWDELKQAGYKYDEIVADVNQDWGGIGVLNEFRGNK